MLTTRYTIQLYFKKVQDKSDWQTMIADDVKFESLLPLSIGRDAYVTAATRFFSMAEKLEVKHLVVEDETACARVSYQLRKNGRTFNCLVSELFEVRRDKITSISILFDAQALSNFTSQS